MKKILVAAFSLGVAVIVTISSIMGGLFAWGIWAALIVVALGIVVILSKILRERGKNRKLPAILTSFAFANEPPPAWLTARQRKELSDLAKAAFVLLLFEQTETGCWGKSYLPRHLARGETLPRALGAITGTPFALLAISSYAERGESEKGTFGRTELLVHESTNYAVFETLAHLLQSDGSYLRGYKESYPGGRVMIPESARHEAGACLIRSLYRGIADRDLRTIERLCMPMTDPVTYDFAVVSRLFFHIPYIDAIPLRLRLKAARKRKQLLAKLVFEIQSAKHTNLAGRSSMRHDSINQWSTAWYVLPLIMLPMVPSAVRIILINRMSQFFLARSSAAATPSSLMPTEVAESGRGTGKSTFGSGVGLVLWRTLERAMPADTMHSKQAQRMVDRLIGSAVDAIEGPMLNPSPEIPEGYLGWGAICLGAASVGIRISYDDCEAAVTLAKKLNDEPVGNRSANELKNAYADIIKNNRFLNEELVGHVAGAAARLSVIYEPVKKAKEAIDSAA